MATIRDEVHEGVKKEVTITIDSDTASDLDSQTVKLYAYKRKDGTETELGETTISSTSVVFTSADIDLLDENEFYYFEAWVNKDSDTRQCIWPNDDDDHLVRIVDRYGVA